jgi:hypothetical protein
MKKGIGFFFVLAANIILLAHAIIPHHHHKAEETIVCSKTQTDGIVHKHTSNKSEHEHHSGRDYDCCLLKQVEVIPANSFRQVCKCKDFNDTHSQLCDYQAVLTDNKTNISVPEFEINPGPLIQFTYSQIVHVSLGLRAPPTV